MVFLGGIVVAIAAFLAYRFGAESRPDFLDPRRKHGRWL